uniref:Uncharacterized protein n=1 Tax=Chromera velia CCMP2878 TaxID=1169474 RepID=A0A0G4FIG5_9ALVE|eukprot:Cvel_17190.t1-p1 / transcript=Cvel_17190.t1 / gene=Cvel_17190 / organism=Chromera_velia_CCMP2878 / gene_product=hypothetical protein / transcript_product=hypothetical protein / location=Cvel_scaffold1358:16720-21971(+) / protein_length=566 / sequence_SO=supercontig / SO=protein_coding / is_pseudo=false
METCPVCFEEFNRRKQRAVKCSAEHSCGKHVATQKKADLRRCPFCREPLKQECVYDPRIAHDLKERKKESLATVAARRLIPLPPVESFGGLGGTSGGARPSASRYEGGSYGGGNYGEAEGGGSRRESAIDVRLIENPNNKRTSLGDEQTPIAPFRDGEGDSGGWVPDSLEAGRETERGDGFERRPASRREEAAHFLPGMPSEDGSPATLDGHATGAPARAGGDMGDGMPEPSIVGRKTGDGTMERGESIGVRSASTVSSWGEFKFEHEKPEDQRRGSASTQASGRGPGPPNIFDTGGGLPPVFYRRPLTGRRAKIVLCLLALETALSVALGVLLVVEVRAFWVAYASGGGAVADVQCEDGIWDVYSARYILLIVLGPVLYAFSVGISVPSSLRWTTEKEDDCQRRANSAFGVLNCCIVGYASIFCFPRNRASVWKMFWTQWSMRLLGVACLSLVIIARFQSRFGGVGASTGEGSGDSFPFCPFDGPLDIRERLSMTVASVLYSSFFILVILFVCGLPYFCCILAPMWIIFAWFAMPSRAEVLGLALGIDVVQFIKSVQAVKGLRTL